MLDFRIETFLTACRHMNFTAAAEELHITQPAVSQHIRFLEKKYGAELFVRDGKRLELTRAGEILKRTMITMENDQRAMEKRMRESGNAVRTLTMGVTMTIGEYAVTGPLARYLNLHPDVNVCTVRQHGPAFRGDPGRGDGSGLKRGVYPVRGV